MRLLDLLNTSTAFLEKHEIVSPRLTTELMLAEVLQLTRLQLYLEYEREIGEKVLARLRPMVKRRAEGEPLEYILGYREFDGHRFKVSPAVLIPRPETELLLKEVVGLADPNLPEPLVDIGTGSGVLAVSLARRFSQLSVWGLDICPAALAVAAVNGEGVGNVRWQESDVLAGWDGRAQVMVANLPYIPTLWLENLPREVRQEPRLALDGGEDGLHVIKRLVTEAAGRTRWLALECAEGHADPLKSLCQEAGYEVTKVVVDFHEVNRILVARYHG
jgi:release factor glutamine methyltransferase